MKPFQYSSALRLILFMMLITSFTSAVAYDFESGGIYYNITSPNTVEVTYRDTNYGSYSGTVEVPSTVTHSSVTYTVTAIGDSAFCSWYDYYYNYSSSNIQEITIPETILTIGNGAFCCYNFILNCLAKTPPTINDSFLQIWPYPLLEGWYGEYKAPQFLCVPEDAYNEYKNSEWHNYFQWIGYIGAGFTDPPTVTCEVGYDDCGLARTAKFTVSGNGTIFYTYEHRAGNWSSISGLPYWNPANSSQFTETFWGSSYSYLNYYDLYAFAVEEGKLPSKVSGAGNDGEPLYHEVSWPCMKPYDYFDIIIDGIAYNFNGNSLSVVPDIVFYPQDVNYEGYYYSCWRYRDYQEYGTGSFIISDSIVYNNSVYKVTSIGDYAFGEGYIPKSEFESIVDFNVYYIFNNGYFSPYQYIGLIVIPNSVTSIGKSAFNGCWEIYEMYLPNSITQIGDSAFYNCPYIHNLHLTGDGEWFGGVLDVEVQQKFDISSRITAIPGMKINPREVYCYAKVPPTCDENTFTDYTGTLHVPESSLAAYFTSPYWCNFANIVGDAVELQSISLNKDSAELLIGEQINLNATMQPANANAEAIQWKSSNPSIATVTSDGVVTAKALGECDIIATCLDKQATCHVKVVEQVVTITLDQHHASLLPNHILTLTPTVSPASTPLAVTSSNPSVAAARLVNGVVQVVGISPGTSVIKVSSANDDAFADSCLVNVYTEVGDVDGDGYVKIDDVTTIIDYLLGGSASNFNAANADVDFDGDIDISDVTELIDHLLSGGTWQNERFMVNGVPFTMVRVAAGSFMMGATEEQGDDANSWEKPVHPVTLSSYMIGQTEVTQELWQAVMGTNPSLHSGSLQKPVENVSWDDCQAFITQLNALTAQHFRMPTEAEWEYAARGGNKSLGYKYAGSNNIDEVGWVTGTTTHPVGELQPNELGLYDMSGNVDEWVWDYFGYYTSEPQTDPTGPETGDNRMYRGGSWYGGANASRVSYRFFRAPTFKRGTMGLRLVL